MRHMLKIGAAALAISCVGAQAWAQNASCAGPQDMLALQAAAVQQRLMVAALSCDAISLYNEFVTTYQRDLQNSDRALLAFFRRLNPGTGMADYNAYKTRLANGSSITSIGDMRAYCAQAQAVFDSALGDRGQNLAAFMLAQPYVIEDSYAACEPAYRMAGGVAAPADVPVPQSKPEETVIPAAFPQSGTN